MRFPHCKSFGKDKVIFVTKEDHAVASSIQLPAQVKPEGFMKSTGELNWDCPCVRSAITGPCGVEYREAVSSLFLEEPDISASTALFQKLKECQAKYPTIYSHINDDDDDDKDELDDLPNINKVAESLKNETDLAQHGEDGH